MTRTIVVLTVVLAVSGAARAADRPERRAIDEASRREGVGRSSVSLAARSPRAGAGPLAASLASRLGVRPASVRNESAGPGEVRVQGAEWHLRLQTDGSVGELVRNRSSRPISATDRLGDDVLVARAKVFVDATLATPLAIQPQDIYPLKTSHQIRRAVSKSGAAAPERVVSSAVVFGRKLDGLPVLGPGSKIVVDLSTDGEVIGCRYDWSRLALKNERQAIASVDTVLRRGTEHTRLRGLRTQDYARMECGYYDAGIDATDSGAALQAACMMQEVRRDASGTIAVEEVVPAGIDVRPDGGWPLAERLVGAPLRVGRAPVPIAEP